MATQKDTKDSASMEGNEKCAIQNVHRSTSGQYRSLLPRARLAAFYDNVQHLTILGSDTILISSRGTQCGSSGTRDVAFGILSVIVTLLHYMAFTTNVDVFVRDDLASQRMS